MKTAITSSLEERALALLGSGVASQQVASILGVEPSRISQLMSEEGFASALAERRYLQAEKYNIIDSKYDALEDSLLTRLEEMKDNIYKPLELVRVLSVLNGAKRRGATGAPTIDNEKKELINLTMPIQIINRFEVNAQNQVMKAGEQDLVTIQSSSLEQLADNSESALAAKISTINLQNAKNEEAIGVANG